MAFRRPPASSVIPAGPGAGRPDISAPDAIHGPGRVQDGAVGRRTGKAVLSVVVTILLSAALGPAGLAWAAPAVQNGSGTGGGPSSSPADYLLVAAGLGAWMAFSLWLAVRHRRAMTAAHSRAVAAVGDEAEEWLRRQ